MTPVYPIGVLLSGCPCLVVGGGRVAWRKAQGLAACGARVTVVSPRFGPELLQLDGVERVQRPFRSEDADGKVLAFAATSEPTVNRAVAEAARDRGVWVNVVDTPEECDFFVPAVVRRGPLAIAVSTGGAAPALARRIRRQLEEQFPEPTGEFVALLGELRAEVIGRVQDPAARRRILRRLAEEGTWRLFQARGPEAVRALAQSLVEGPP